MASRCSGFQFMCHSPKNVLKTRQHLRRKWAFGVRQQCRDSLLSLWVKSALLLHYRCWSQFLHDTSNLIKAEWIFFGWVTKRRTSFIFGEHYWRGGFCPCIIPKSHISFLYSFRSPTLYCNEPCRNAEFCLQPTRWQGNTDEQRRKRRSVSPALRFHSCHLWLGSSSSPPTTLLSLSGSHVGWMNQDI